MEKINIYELLKGCPKGMELDCTMIDNVVFEKLDFSSSHHPIIIRRTDSNTTIHLTKYGQYSDEEDYKCIIFPKGKTTWEEFVSPCKFKDGDAVVTTLGSIAIIRKPMGVESFYAYGFMINNDFYKDEAVFVKVARFATEEEKQKLFNVIKDNGYKWNEETKTLEKLPKFKVGDRVKSKTSQYEYTIVDIGEDVYFMTYETSKYAYHVPFYNEDTFELVPDKFDITTLVPFESKVLVRNVDGDLWKPALYGFLPSKGGCYVVGGTYWKQCIPYEGNEHLLGKTDDCDGKGYFNVPKSVKK